VGATPLFQAFRQSALGDFAAPTREPSSSSASSLTGPTVFPTPADMPLQRLPDDDLADPIPASRAESPAWSMPELPLATVARPEAAASTNAASAIGALQRAAAAAGDASPEVSFPLLAVGAAGGAAQPGTVQRVIGENEAIAQVSDQQTTNNSNDEQTEKIELSKLDLDELSERVWSRIRRKLRIERERSRGIV
jgi:hypothetical protein